MNVILREVSESDLEVFFEDQRDPESVRMADFPSRDREAFFAHWAKILADSSCAVQTIVTDGRVAGNVCAWGDPKERLVGYWVGRSFWGKGIASQALAQFLDVERTRPLYAHVAIHNAGSIRVLEKCGFVPLAQDEEGEPNGSAAGERILVLAGPS